MRVPISVITVNHRHTSIEEFMFNEIRIAFQASAPKLEESNAKYLRDFWLMRNEVITTESLDTSPQLEISSDCIRKLGDRACKRASVASRDAEPTMLRC